MTRILIADDQPAITKVLEAYARQSDMQADIAYDGKEAWDLFLQREYDAVLLDVMMPEMDGFTLSKKIREISRVPILLVTARGEDYDRIMGLDLGADDYIVKPFSAAEVMARVRAVLRRAEPPSHADRQVVRVGNLIADYDSFEATIGGQNVELTKKEFDLLWLMAGHPGRVFSRDHLLDTLWGWDYEGDSRTVDTHIKRLRAKIGKLPAGWTIETVRGIGYRLERTE